MENIRFSFLSPGYCGVEVEQSTLNSRYLGLVNEQYLSKRCAFLSTQRMPRYGFFDELRSCETTAALNSMAEYRKSVLSALSEMTERSRIETLDFDDGSFALSLVGLCRRLGIKTDFQLSFSTVDQKIAWHLAEFDHSVNLAVSNDLAPNFSIIEEIFRRFMKDDSATVAAKGRICVRAIAALSRHARYLSEHSKSMLNDSSEFLQAMLKSIRPNSFSESVTFAMALRALPMKSEISVDAKIDLVSQSIDFIKIIPLENSLQRIVRDELLYTTQLTVAKTLMASTASITQVEQAFKELIVCDPYDSTGYSELAMYLMNQGMKAGAAEAFTNAIGFGPPAYAMNYYFLGKIQMETGLINSALESWKMCSMIDATAISPVIDSINALLEIGNVQEARELKVILMSSEDLISQITEEDRNVLAKI